MATAAGIIITTGAITLVNEALSVPFVPGNTNVLKGINWRVIPATAIAAFMFSGFESVNATAARGVAAMALLTMLLVGVGSNPSPVQNIANALGYTGTGGNKVVVQLPGGGTQTTIENQ